MAKIEGQGHLGFGKFDNLLIQRITKFPKVVIYIIHQISTKTLVPGSLLASPRCGNKLPTLDCAVWILKGCLLNVKSATHPIGQASEWQCPNDIAKHTNC